MKGFVLKQFFVGTCIVVGLSFTASARENVDLDIINKIRDEGFNRSEVIQTLSHLTDKIGPRLTGSPALKEANIWTKKKLAKWGLKKAHLAGFKFGPGWTMQRVEVFMTAPRRTQLYAMPISWHPGTKGVLEAKVIHAPLRSKADFKKWEGKLKGKIVLVDRVTKQQEPNNKTFRRLDAESLKKTSDFNVQIGNTSGIDGWVKYKSFFYVREQFLAKEGAVAMVRRSPRGAMLIDAGGYQHMEGKNATIPAVTLSQEHYNRAVRLLKSGETVKLSLDVDASFHNEDMKSYSTIAEIPGKGRRPEIVMAGAHLDSWFVGDGALDNGAGIAVVMEAVRILKAIGVKPKRTIRVGLWGGEEQGYYGSQQYVLDNLVSRPKNTDEKLKYMSPYEKYYGQFPVTYKPEFDRFSAYFNLDNGSGKIRGVYAEGNAAVAPIFQEWLQPFHDLGAETVTLNATGGTDHEPFDDIGLPGFQFIQDPLDYGSRLHHSQIDMLDHAYEKDLKQASVIMASFLYNAAMRDKMLPRKPLPTAPKATARKVIKGKAQKAKAQMAKN
jgi:carboxypeptidase Q